MNVAGGRDALTNATLAKHASVNTAWRIQSQVIIASNTVFDFTIINEKDVTYSLIIPTTFSTTSSMLGLLK